MARIGPPAVRRQRRQRHRGGISDISLVVETGDPAEELIRASRDTDLLVLGSRGSGGFARLLLGSVSSKVVHHAACSVVIVR